MDCGALKRMAVALGFVVMVGSVVVMVEDGVAYWAGVVGVVVIEVVSVGLLYFCSKE